MSLSSKVRKAVMERDHRECQFFCGGQPATQVAHRDHQGAGGLPVSHWKNQPPNLAAACDQCHGRHQTELLWVEFEPADVGDDGEVLDVGRMVVRTLDGELVPEENLWFYQRWVKRAAELASKSLQTIGVIDNLVGQMMHDLRLGSHMLPEGGEFDQYVSSLGWDPIKAGKVADAFEWALEFGGWPEGVPYSKIELLFNTDWAPLKSMDGEVAADNCPQAYLQRARGGSSYSSLQQELQEAKLAQANMRNYLVGDIDALFKAGALIRTSEELRLLRLAGARGLGVLKINAFKGRLTFQRGRDAGLVDKANPARRIHPMSLDDFAEEAE